MEFKKAAEEYSNTNTDLLRNWFAFISYLLSLVLSVSFMSVLSLQDDVNVPVRCRKV